MVVTTLVNLPPLLQVLFLHAIVATIIATRPSPLIRTTLSALLIYVVYQLSVGLATARGTGSEYANASWFGSILLWLPLSFWLDDPMTWRYKNEGVLPEMYPLWKRVYYALCILWNPRFIGWSTQVINIPPPRTKSRAEFLSRAVFAAVKLTLIIDFVKTYMKLQSLHELWGTPAYPTGFRGYVVETLFALARGVITYTTFKRNHVAIAMACVATGFVNGDPEMWPDLFGSWSDAYTLRRFWGRTWHQNVRAHLSACGDAVASAVRFKKGSNASSCTQLYTAFFLSGLFHSFGDLAIGEPFGKSIPFFLSNAIAITFEDAIIRAARRLMMGSTAGTEIKGKEGPPRRWVRVLGYTWVFLWFSCSMRLVPWLAIPPRARVEIFVFRDRAKDRAQVSARFDEGVTITGFDATS